MTTPNDKIILDQIIEERKNSYNPRIRTEDYFEIFTTEEILKEKDLSTEEVENLITDGTRDGGIDSVAIFINDRLIRSTEDIEESTKQTNLHVELNIIQSSIETGFKDRKIQTIFCTVTELLDLQKSLESSEAKYNSSLLNAFETFRDIITRTATKFPKISIRFVYANMAIEPPHDNVKLEAERLKKETERLFPGSHVSFDFFDCGRLREIVSKRKKTSYQIKVDEVMPVDNAYVCLVRLDNYYLFLKDDNSEKLNTLIFEQNVRDYEKNVQVNQNIRATLENPKVELEEDFWWLNNGVTIVASQANSSGKTLTIEDPQIVNGQQTSNEIFNFFSTKPNYENSKKILVRVIKSNNEEVRSKIIKATNSQTFIPPAQLYATDLIHHHIDQFFLKNGLFYEKRKNFYRNQGKSLRDIISISYLAQCVMAILLHKPHEARARPSSLLKNSNSYEEIFSERTELDVFLKIAQLAKKAHEILTKIKVEYEGMSNVFFHTLLYAVAKATGKNNCNADDLGKLDMSLFSDAFLETAFKEVYCAISTYCTEKSRAIDQVAKNSNSTSLVINLFNQINLDKYQKNKIQIAAEMSS